MTDDVVAELEALINPRNIDRVLTLSALLTRARAEIMALREIAARPSSELHALTKERDELRETVERQRFVLSKGHAETRSDALEEAAQVCELSAEIMQPDERRLGDAIAAVKSCAAAIRKLKGEGHG